MPLYGTFVDLLNAQSVAGTKTFTSQVQLSGGAKFKGGQNANFENATFDSSATITNTGGAGLSALTITNTISGFGLTLSSTGNAGFLLNGFAAGSAAEYSAGVGGARVWHWGLQGDNSFAFVESGVAVWLTIANGGAVANAQSIKSTHATAGIGYGTGAGGTITQLTSKATGVTLSKVSGAITLNAAALAASTTVSFVLTNTAIAATDVLILNHISGGTVGSYTLNAQAAAGSATINVRNVSLGSLSEAIVIQFAVIKAVNA